MGHLTPETLARLIDEAADARESAHLDGCDRCRAELEALREQTGALGDLPDPRPPADGWNRLADRLETEGLVTEADLNRRRRSAGSPWWMQLAASLALVLFGGLIGFVARGAAGTTEGGALAGSASADSTPAAVASAADAESPEEAARALEIAESNYRAALARFSEMTARPDASDPVARLAALEGIVLTTREALRQAPADPLINGYHMAAAAERDAMIRQLALEDDDPWF